MSDKTGNKGGGEGQGFVDRGFWIKLGMDYGFLTSSLLNCEFEMVSQWIGSFLHRIKDFVSENNGFWIRELYVTSTFITKGRSFT